MECVSKLIYRERQGDDDYDVAQANSNGRASVVRVTEGVDPTDHRMKFRDYVGHVVSWDGYTLELVRDAAANGSRPAQNVTIHQEQIATLKPIPEHPVTPPRP